MVGDFLNKDTKIAYLSQIQGRTLNESNTIREEFFDAGFKYGDMIETIIYHLDKEVYHDTILFHKSFGMAKKGDVMIYNNELKKIAMAVSVGNVKNII